MPSPAFGTAGTQLQGTASTMNVDVPSSVAANDIIVVTAFVDSTATVTGLATDFAQAPDSPVVVSTGQSGQHRLYVMWKRAAGSEDTAGTYNFTLSGSVYRNAQAIRYTGAVTSGDPWDVTNSAESGATAVSTTPAVSDTTTVADTLLVFAGSNWSGGLWTAPTGFTERRDSGDRVVTVDDKAQAASGATGSITATCAGTGHSGAWLGALKSTAGTPSTNAPAGNAAATGTASQPVSGVSGNAGIASAAGVANQPTVDIGAPSTNAPAGLAAVTAAASPVVAGLGVNAGVAAATGAGLVAAAGLGVRPGFGDVAGAAPQPSVQTGAFTNAPAGLAAVTGTANAPRIAIQAFAGVAASTATTPTATGLVGARPTAGTATGTAPAAGVLVGAIALAGVASGTATTNQPTPFISPNAGLALVTTVAPAAEGRGDLPVERISDPLGLTALTPGSSLAAVDAPLTLEALED